MDVSGEFAVKSVILLTFAVSRFFSCFTRLLVKGILQRPAVFAGRSVYWNEIWKVHLAEI